MSWPERLLSRLPRRRRWWIAGGGLLALGGLGALSLWRQTLPEQGTAERAEALIPAGAIAALELQPRRQGLKRELLGQLPWLGQLESSLQASLLPPSPTQGAQLVWLRNSGMVQAPVETVLVLPLEQPGAWQQTLDQWQRQGLWRETARAGQSRLGRLQGRASLALLGDRFLLLGTRDTSLRPLLEAYQGRDALISNPQYQQSCGAATGPGDRLYLNWPALNEAAAAQGYAMPLPPLALGVCGHLGPSATGGLEWRGQSWVAAVRTPLALPQAAGVTAEPLAPWLPGQPWLWWQGHDLPQQWLDARSGVGLLLPLLGTLPNEFRQLTGQDWERSWLPRFRGSWAVALLPTADGRPRQGFRATLVAIAQTPDRSGLDRAWQQIEQRARLRTRREGAQVLWLDAQGHPLARRGWFSPTVAYLAVGASLAGRPQPGLPWLQSLPPADQDSLYLNLRDLSRKGLLQGPPQLQQILRPFGQLQLTTEAPTAGRTGFSLQLRP